ncbi:MAG: hypothetical protein M9941_10025 [Anaerolineae bacterium]|nr:hypothetical protein [Anaerolineae bacterium]MCO5198065.1 hypothetical protein [Anaerolineae bacterium]
MNRRLARFGVLPSLFVGILLAAIGLWALNWLVNEVWPISPNLTNSQYLEVQRGIAEDRFSADTLLRVSNGEAIALFLVAVGITAMGLIMPLAYFINRRVQLWLLTREDKQIQATTGRTAPRRKPAPASLLVTMRQSLWFGIWVAFCMWLQINRTFGLAVAGLVAIVLVLLELLLMMRSLSVQRTVSSRRTRQTQA